MFTSSQIRTLRAEFRQSKQHVEAKPASLVTSDQDKTVLFNIAGMQPIVPYLSGKPHPNGKRLYNIQRCIRTNDIDEVGDNTHCTFFEMMGNRSLGDYFKKESLTRSIEFLTTKLGLAFYRLGFTVFGGSDDGTIPLDQEAIDILLDLGVDPANIQKVPMYQGKKCDNFRGPAGPIGPCGPSCEIYYDKGDAYGEDDKDFVDNDTRYVEIRNNVFMEFYKDKEGNLTPLAHKNIDTGMGFERLMTFLQEKNSMYETDLFFPLMILIDQLSHHELSEGGSLPEKSVEKSWYLSEIEQSTRIVAEHIRSSVFLLADGVIPSNEGRGYVLRRLIRRMWFHFKKRSSQSIVDVTLIVTSLVKKVSEIYGKYYDHIVKGEQHAITQLTKEIQQFEKTLKQGSREFDRHITTIKAEGNRVSGQIAFLLYDTFGFPFDLTKDLASQQGFEVDEEGFKKEMLKAKQRSKQGANKKFTKDIDRASYLDGIEPTVFVGYDYLEADDVTLLKDFTVDGQRVLVFDRSPLYAESGGQIGDKGTFIDDQGNKLTIVDVKKYDGVWLHMVEE